MVVVVGWPVCPLCHLIVGNLRPVSHTVTSPSREPLDLGVPGFTLIEQGRILASRSVGFPGVGQGRCWPAFSPGQAGLPRVSWARGPISIEVCLLCLDASVLGTGAHFSSVASEFTAQSLGASGLCSACHHPGHCLLALLREQAPDLGCCVFPGASEQGPELAHQLQEAAWNHCAWSRLVWVLLHSPGTGAAGNSVSPAQILLGPNPTVAYRLLAAGKGCGDHG